MVTKYQSWTNKKFVYFFTAQTEKNQGKNWGKQDSLIVDLIPWTSSQGTISDIDINTGQNLSYIKDTHNNKNYFMNFRGHSWRSNITLYSGTSRINKRQTKKLASWSENGPLKMQSEISANFQELYHETSNHMHSITEEKSSHFVFKACHCKLSSQHQIWS